MTVTWREDEPRLTAAGVEAASFPRTPWGRRGYDEAAVNGFLGQVQAELVLLANEKTELADEVMRLRRRFIGPGHPRVRIRPRQFLLPGVRHDSHLALAVESVRSGAHDQER